MRTKSLRHLTSRLCFCHPGFGVINLWGTESNCSLNYCQGSWPFLFQSTIANTMQCFVGFFFYLRDIMQGLLKKMHSYSYISLSQLLRWRLNRNILSAEEFHIDWTFWHCMITITLQQITVHFSLCVNFEVIWLCDAPSRHQRTSSEENSFFCVWAKN